jgi:hypothetical protein
MRQVSGRRGVWGSGWLNNWFKPFNQFNQFEPFELFDRLNRFERFLRRRING